GCLCPSRPIREVLIAAAGVLRSTRPTASEELEARDAFDVSHCHRPGRVGSIQNRRHPARSGGVGLRSSTPLLRRSPWPCARLRVGYSLQVVSRDVPCSPPGRPPPRYLGNSRRPRTRLLQN